MVAKHLAYTLETHMVFIHLVKEYDNVPPKKLRLWTKRDSKSVCKKTKGDYKLPFEFWVTSMQKWGSVQTCSCLKCSQIGLWITEEDSVEVLEIVYYKWKAINITFRNGSMNSKGLSKY